MTSTPDQWTCIHKVELPSRAGSQVAFAGLGLSPSVQHYLERVVPEGLYSHQHRAIDGSLAGKDVCLATSTASGKTLAFAVAGLETILRNPSARVLALYPQKALGAEQEERWRATLRLCGLSEHTVCRIDGSVSTGSRASLLKTARVAVMTPDVIHSWLLSSPDAVVRRFLAEIRLVIVDEVHTYTGVFGSNSAFLFRRLQHVNALRGGSLRFFCASATIRDPERHLINLFGKAFEIVGPEADTSPRQPVRIEFLRPAGGEDFLKVLTELLLRLTHEPRERFLTFVDSRKQTEQIATILARATKADLSNDDDDDSDLFGESPLRTAEILPYRSGYEEPDRREIQRRLTAGSLMGVVSTSALELGMDIPHLDTVVLVGVPRSSTSLQQRIGRVGRNHPGRVLVLHSGDLYDEAIFQEPESLLSRPPVESALYLENPYIQYIHALCLARSGGEHESVAGTRDSDTEFSSPIPWPQGFLDLCTAERTGQIPVELQPMKAEAGDTPHYAFPLRDVEQQFKITIVHGPNRRDLGSASYSQVLREAYPGAVYYYAAQPNRIISISTAKREILAKRERYYHTQPTRLPTCVFPNLSEGNVFAAVEFGDQLRVIESNLQIREAVAGLKERRGSAETSYPYPLTGEPAGVTYQQSRFTRNYFTTGVLLHHRMLSHGGCAEHIASLVFEALLMVAPYERQDIGAAADRVRSSPNLLPSGATFAAVFDQTYGSLRLSGRLLEAGVFRKVIATARELALTAMSPGYPPAVHAALDVLEAAASHEPTAVRSDGEVIPEEYRDMPRVIIPGSRGINVTRGNAEFEIEKIVFNPRLGGLTYVGKHLTSRSVEGQSESVRLDAIVEIPGESQLGYYDYDTGEVRV